MHPFGDLAKKVSGRGHGHYVCVFVLLVVIGALLVVDGLHGW